MQRRIVFVRHGESEWNQQNRFTGWTDVDLTLKGIEEAKQAAQLLREGGYLFDAAFTSVLKRAIRTLWLVLDGTDQMWLPVTRAWQLNERHYGDLQGLNKIETAQKYGDEQVHIWRRSFSTPPTALKKSDPRHPSHDRRYARIPKREIPSTESLKDCMARVVPYWKKVLLPRVKKGERLIVVAHGNSIRALVKHLDNVSDAAIAELNIPTGIPLVYEFDRQWRAKNHFYLGDAKAAAAAAQAVAAQSKL